MIIDGNCQELFPNDANAIKNIQHGLSNIENLSLPSANKGRNDKALISVITQREKRHISYSISIWWYPEEAYKLFGLDDNTMESTYQHLSAQYTTMKIFHDEGDYLPSI